MSDVLTNLLARSTASVTAIRPLAASLYAPMFPEPQSPAQSLEQEQETVALPPAALERKPPGAVVGSTRPEQAVRVAPADRPRPAVPRERVQDKRPAHDARPSPALDPALVDRLVQRTLHGLPHATPPPPAAATAVERLTTVREAGPPSPPERTHVRAATLVDVRPAPSVPLPEPARATGPVPAPVGQRVEPASRTVEAAPPPLPVVTPRRPMLPPLPDAPRRRVEFAGQAAAVPAAPAVQVSIGRIEVRAQPSGQPQRREPPRPAVMTLDEYVRRREGGAR